MCIAGIVHTIGGYMVYTAITFQYVFDYHEDDPTEVFWCTADIGWVCLCVASYSEEPPEVFVEVVIVARSVAALHSTLLHSQFDHVARITCTLRSLVILMSSTDLCSMAPPESSLKVRVSRDCTVQ